LYQRDLILIVLVIVGGFLLVDCFYKTEESESFKNTYSLKEHILNYHSTIEERVKEDWEN
jgi:hypothetical protein